MENQNLKTSRLFTRCCKDDLESGQEMELLQLPSTSDTVFFKNQRNEGLIDKFDVLEENTQDDNNNDLENSIIQLIWKDDNTRLVSLMKEIGKISDTGNEGAEKIDAWSLVVVTCSLDSVLCLSAIIEGETGSPVKINKLDKTGKTPLHYAAQMHSSRCVNFLLHKHASTDQRSKEGLKALELALHSRRMHVNWTVDEDVQQLLFLLSNKDLSSLQPLVSRTKNVEEIAYRNAMDGNIVALAALLFVGSESLVSAKIATGDEREASLYESIVKRTVSFAASGDEKREVLVKEIELLHLFDAHFHRFTRVAPLIRASEAGDATVVKLILQTKCDVNETDVDGNSALHWCLRASWNSHDTSVLGLLLKDGARVSVRNRLGLTPLHVAAAHGHFHALQLLLSRDPDGVDLASETRETPLFYAVKNDYMDCAQLLLRYGANRQAFNLRKQRPIDLATSEDMRYMLSQMSFYSWNPNATHIVDAMPGLGNESCSPEADEMLTSLEDECENSKRSSPIMKTEICRYFEAPGGCVRGDRCFYAHGADGLRRAKGVPWTGEYCFSKRAVDNLSRKIFIGGLHPSIDSDHLRDFFEANFGPVEDATVINRRAGALVQSRGFGFVTFEREDSVAAAVEAQFVTIWGKKVEIKSAISKPNPVAIASSEPWPLPSLDEATPIANHDHFEVPWLRKFKKWFPEFLEQMAKRNGGEWYPLSSLKGDFRAACRLELNHESLGYLKLSDFMRSMPGICGMKIVPIGRGLATHMVLYPLGKGQRQDRQDQQLMHTDESSWPSLDAGPAHLMGRALSAAALDRSYADVAGRRDVIKRPVGYERMKVLSYADVAGRAVSKTPMGYELSNVQSYADVAVHRGEGKRAAWDSAHRLQLDVEEAGSIPGGTPRIATQGMMGQEGFEKRFVSFLEYEGWSLFTPWYREPKELISACQATKEFSYFTKQLVPDENGRLRWEDVQDKGAGPGL
ncbi:hypothetical protein AMTR_s00142p00024640 [Amborella trichopoda]|uniref:Uncharacterized protein n=2 Tax=Amborella trichopoda TaxID=13333 RepID=W1PDI0_AMBTC|nr:hypothetical protein AMTR_s00142p00024640 [Amborella trichopoda]